nr:hypothetical protein 1 [Balneolaceae bacterium]
MAKQVDDKFQISIDTDSIFISQAPNTDQSRVVLSNLGNTQLHQLAKSIIDANLAESFQSILEEKTD